ncbi:AraC family transcriptional regulator [Chitinophaga filiformis]|uniref:AraC family transcriptional regulator n=1 Tax=Chitinophaga filiformis TaxID=104663 RepID=UPI001F1BC69A|nr:helix-turn-helix transcriptional regulator [Chitinophaga filiformis]MCF6406856.1 AraC family transcriptional regulator [Chitinophaga filiformis]
MENIPVRNIITAEQGEPFNNFSIRDLRELLAGKDMVQELHRHNFFYVLALKKGKGTHEIDFTSYDVADNTIFFMRPGQVHQLTLKAGSTGYLMSFTTDFYSTQNTTGHQLLRKASSMNHYRSDNDGCNKLTTPLDNIYREYNAKQEQYQEVIKANLHIFFVELARQYNKASSGNMNLYTQERLEEFLSLLETHITNVKQASEYADMMHLSLYQLNAVIKATLNKTCSEMINEHIILEAKRYLLATSSQVNQIADSLGYEDVSYFIRFFKKHTGSTPEVFRQQFRSV